jgi:uncharacterized spore protein YtfJ
MQARKNANSQKQGQGKHTGVGIHAFVLLVLENTNLCGINLCSLTHTNRSSLAALESKLEDALQVVS